MLSAWRSRGNPPRSWKLAGPRLIVSKHFPKLVLVRGGGWGGWEKGCRSVLNVRDFFSVLILGLGMNSATTVFQKSVAWPGSVSRSGPPPILLWRRRTMRSRDVGIMTAPDTSLLSRRSRTRTLSFIILLAIIVAKLKSNVSIPSLLLS